MDDTARDIVYFKYCGEVNTTNTLRLARERSEMLGIRRVVVASETGRSALKAAELFEGSGVSLIVVTHYPATTTGPEGRIPIGLNRPEYAERLEALVERDVAVVQGTRPLAPPSRAMQWDGPTPEGVLDKTLGVFGAGTKIAIEVSIMATDAGEVDEGEEVITCAGTFKGLDTAMVVRATHSLNFFGSFEIHEIIARPRYRVRQLPEYEFENWRGDLEAYYV
jgi:hypothetical protein